MGEHIFGVTKTTNAKGEDHMDIIEARIDSLEKEIAECRVALKDAEEALDAAEKELGQVLAELPE